MRDAVRLSTLPLALLALSACSGGGGPMTDGGIDGTHTDTGADVAIDVWIPPVALFDTENDITQSSIFYDYPWPNDLRLTSSGTPDFTGFPHPGGIELLDEVVAIAGDRPGFSTLSVAYFHFTAPIAPQDPTVVIDASAGASILLVDIDATSPEHGRLFPIVAATPEQDQYLPANVLAVAARPGVVLSAGRTYAFVVMSALGDGHGHQIARSHEFAELVAGNEPDGPRGMPAVSLYAPLFATLPTLGIDPDDVAVATVFTTGDVVAATSQLGDSVLAAPQFAVQIENLALAPGDDPTTHPRFCELLGTVTYPQFQNGTPPFDSDGLFQFDDSGLPIPVNYATMPNYATAPIALTLPRTAMPSTGFPLVVYFHGSGGVSTEVVDRGIWAPESATNPCPGETDVWMGVTGCNQPGEGPAYVLAPRGFATAGSALPLNPERLPGASETEYINLNNPAAMRDTFRQGVLEQRLFIQALSQLTIPSSLVAQCAGVTLPSGADGAQFDVSRLVAQGQSMGGMYTNLVSATEPAVQAAIPTGAGGFWTYFILQTQLIPGAAAALGVVLHTEVPLTFMHPALSTLETAWEPIDPMVSMPRLAHAPLPSHPVRPIYEPVAPGDSYFPTPVYDAMALAYGHREAGAQIWSTMQDALALDGLNGILPYPVTSDVLSGSARYTGVVVQYMGDGVYDPHSIFTQLDAVKYQYSCFAQTFVATGTATVLDPTGMAADGTCTP